MVYFVRVKEQYLYFSYTKNKKHAGILVETDTMVNFVRDNTWNSFSVQLKGVPQALEKNQHMIRRRARQISVNFCLILSYIICDRLEGEFGS